MTSGVKKLSEIRQHRGQWISRTESLSYSSTATLNSYPQFGHWKSTQPSSSEGIEMLNRRLSILPPFRKSNR